MKLPDQSGTHQHQSEKVGVGICVDLAKFQVFCSIFDHFGKTVNLAKIVTLFGSPAELCCNIVDCAELC